MTANGAYGYWSTVEERYVDEVRKHLHDVPGRQRKALVAIVAADLAERPAAENWDHLVAEVGDPVVCAAAIRAEHGLPAHVGVGGHLRAVRGRTWAASGLVAGLAVLLALGGVVHHRWATAEPGLTNNCSGAGAGDGGVTEFGVAVEQLEAAGESETVLTYVDGAEVELFLCLSAEPGVEVLDVRVVDVPQTMFRQYEIRAASGRLGVDDDSPVLDGPAAVSRSGLQLLVAGHLANCEWYTPGGGMTINEAEVTYRYRGRTRTVPVDLGTQYTFLIPTKGDCPRPRRHG